MNCGLILLDLGVYVEFWGFCEMCGYWGKSGDKREKRISVVGFCWVYFLGGIFFL